MSALNEIFSCRRCGADWDGERKRGQKPLYCAPCRPLAIKERNAANAKRWREANREKIREAAKRRYAENPGRFREYARKTRYGISADQYDGLFQAQGGGCGICGVTECQTGRVMAVDHCHATGRVRGILCNFCNSTLLPGYEALPERLRDSAHLNAYLERDPFLIREAA